MSYLKDDKIDDVIKSLRTKYSNDNIFKSYIQSLVIITSHMENSKNINQKLTKINKFTIWLKKNEIKIP